MLETLKIDFIPQINFSSKMDSSTNNSVYELHEF